jgi:hypothetical protein
VPRKVSAIPFFSSSSIQLPIVPCQPSSGLGEQPLCLLHDLIGINRLNSSVPGVFKFSTAVRYSKYSFHCFSVIVGSNGARRSHLSIHFLAFGVVGALILNLGPPHCGSLTYLGWDLGKPSPSSTLRSRRYSQTTLEISWRSKPRTHRGRQEET